MTLYSTYSRKIKIEETKNKKRTIFFILLTIITIILIVIYGIPIVVKFVTFLSDLNQSNEAIEIHDKTPPPPPKLTGLPSATKENNIEIKGNTEAGAKVIINFNNNKEEILADSSGNFSFKINLLKGENYIYAKAIDSSGNESQKSDTQKVIYDTEPPILEIIKPLENTEFYGSKQRQLLIEGKTEENNKVQINQRQVVVDSLGGFSYLITLQPGENNFTIIAEDEAGNKTEKNIKVYFTP